MKIAVIFTGGTIGSRQKEEGWIGPDSRQSDAIIRDYRMRNPLQAKEIEFICKTPYMILSENLNADCLMLLIETVQDCIQQGGFDGILVCHGTDTLQYTAAILGYVFADVQLPIILVSSNYPLEDERANGSCNFYYAVETVTNGLNGVMVVYQNSDGNTYVHAGTKLLAHQTFEDDLYSIHKECLGFYSPDGAWHMQSRLPEPERPVAYHGLSGQTEMILWLRIYPACVYPELTESTKAVLVESYHSGTIAMNQEWKEFAEKARKKKIPVYLVGATGTAGGYESMREYEELGIQVLAEQAPIAAYCRLWLEMSHERTIK